ncbi:ABC transporter permease (plasmid) [Deinococcus aetherius]|uniref:ABC transporter permease n=2 Tax=Deinococcus aetherius TaxID=200252 RepID=A0ABM8AKM6_9DEIO|nr:ABC transporter permease [Deinococcus aetherius]
MMRLSPVVNPGPLRLLLVTLAAVLVAALICAGVFALYGVSPLEAYRSMLGSTLGDPVGLSEVARRFIPLLLIGAGLALAYRAQFVNIGGEGQLLLGAVGGSGIALFLPPGPWTLPLMFLLGALAGGLWAWIAVWLKVRYRVNEIVTTLMLNYVAVSLVLYLINGPWKGRNVQGYVYSDLFPDAATLPVLGGTQVHWPTLVLGVLVAAGLQFLLTRSVFGYRLRVVGENPAAAGYAGISAGRVMTLAALITGGAAGLAGVGEVAGIHHRLIEPGQLSLGYGFTAVIVAWLARGNPLAALLTAPLMGVILAGGDVLKIDQNMPFRIVDVFSGVMLLCLIVSELFVQNRVRLGTGRAHG